MEKQIFLIRINPERWLFKGKEKSWEDIGEGNWIPIGSLFESKVKEYGPIIKHKKHIHKIKEKDIVVGYTCGQKQINSLGRIVSNSFDCFDGKRILIQVTTHLKHPISREKIKHILEKDNFLKQSQPTVTFVKTQEWEEIKKMILEENPVEKDIKKLEEGSNKW